MKRKYTIYGDLTDLDGKNIIIFGRTGVGKTTIANRIMKDLSVEVKLFDEVHNVEQAVEAFEAREDGEVNIIVIQSKVEDTLEKSLTRLSKLINEDFAYIDKYNDVFISVEAN